MAVYVHARWGAWIGGKHYAGRSRFVAHKAMQFAQGDYESQKDAIGYLAHVIRGTLVRRGDFTRQQAQNPLNTIAVRDITKFIIVDDPEYIPPSGRKRKRAAKQGPNDPPAEEPAIPECFVYPNRYRSRRKVDCPGQEQLF